MTANQPHKNEKLPKTTSQQNTNTNHKQHWQQQPVLQNKQKQYHQTGTTITAFCFQKITTKQSRAYEENNIQTVTLTKAGMPCKQQHKNQKKSNNVTPKSEQQTKHQEDHTNTNTKIITMMKTMGLLHKEQHQLLKKGRKKWEYHGKTPKLKH